MYNFITDQIIKKVFIANGLRIFEDDYVIRILKENYIRFEFSLSNIDLNNPLPSNLNEISKTTTVVELTHEQMNNLFKNQIREYKLKRILEK